MILFQSIANKNACLLVFNQINKDNNTSFADNVAKTTFKILEPTTTLGVFSVKEIVTTGNWERYGYGHYSSASQFISDLNRNILVLNRITKAGKEVVNNLRMMLSKNQYDYKWYGMIYTEESSSTSYYSRTGYSMVYNPEKALYKFLWIEE